MKVVSHLSLHVLLLLLMLLLMMMVCVILSMLQGVVKEAAFKNFNKEEVATTAAAKQLLNALGVGHYWDAAEHWDPDSAPLEPLV
jgi:uncharacterized membrane protein YeiB